MQATISPDIREWIDIFTGGLTAVGTVGAVIVALYFSRWDRRTLKEARRRNFISFLDGFRSEAERTHPQEFANLFPSRVHELRKEAAKIRPDIDSDRQEKFEGVIKNLCRLTDSQVSDGALIGVADGQEFVGRKRITEAIDDIVRLIQ